MTAIDTASLTRTLLAAADAADAETLPIFRTALSVDNKFEIGFDPVTAADRNAEAAIRRAIAAAFPDHDILGEELGATGGGSPWRWIIDPIDGTRAFISGLPLWGTLIGVSHERSPVAGLMRQPFTGETFLGTPSGTRLLRGGETHILKTRATQSLAEATLFTTDPYLFRTPDRQAAFDRVRKSVRLTRYGCDCYAYCLVAAGQIDLVIESGLQTYDIMPLIPVIEGAGGIVTTWDGAPAIDGGDIIAAANPQVHAAALAILNQTA